MSSPRLEKLKELLKKDPGGAFPLYGLAMEYKSLGRLEEATAAFEELLKEHPHYTAAFLHYGSTLTDLGRSDDACAVFGRGIEVCRAAGQNHAREELEAALCQLQEER